MSTDEGEPNWSAIWDFWRIYIAQKPNRALRLAAEQETLPGQKELNALFDLADHGDYDFVSALRGLVATAPNAEALDWLAAGPVEDFASVVGASEWRRLLAENAGNMMLLQLLEKGKSFS